MATISLFGSASTPADNGSNAGSGVTITPPSSMTAGMLVLVMINVRQTSLGWAEITITNAGGQTWHEIALDDPTVQFETTLVSGRLYACRFTGTWSANPAFDGTVATTVTATMDVFQIDDAAYEFDLDVMVVGTAFTASTTPTITGITTLTNGALVWACWMVTAATTWSSLTGGWSFITNGGANQVRNTAGSDNTSTRAYKVQGTAGASGNVQATQSASTAGLGVIIAFKPILTTTISPTTRPTVDFIIDHEASTDGTVMTPAILQGMVEPSNAVPGSFATHGGVATAITVSTTAELKLSHQHGVQAGSSLQEINDGNATRGALYDHNKGTETFGFDFTFNSNHAKLSLGFMYRTSFQYNNLASYSSIAIFAAGGGEFAVFNLLAQFPDHHVTRLEVNLAPGLVCGPPFLNDHTYWINILMDTTNSVAKMAIWDVDNNWRRHGFTVTLPIDGSQPINILQLYCTGGAFEAHPGFSKYDDFCGDFTTAAFPLLPGVGGNVPPPPFDYVPIALRM